VSDYGLKMNKTLPGVLIPGEECPQNIQKSVTVPAVSTPLYVIEFLDFEMRDS
jgi:hypothetical protein